MRILFYGDIVGEVGRNAVHFSVPRLVKKYDVDFVIANAENATHGKGLSENNYNYLVLSGVDCMTLGNHYHAKSQIDDYIDEAEHLVRPLNLLNYEHGLGSAVYDIDGIDIRVTNIMGQAFMKEEVASPYDSLTKLLNESEPSIHIVDFHADSTSEKAIFGYFYDGKVSAVLGTHTHVQTNDAKVLPGGTGFCSDVGMCGDPDGVIGFEKRSVISKIVLGGTGPFQLNPQARMMINAVLLEIDDETFLTTNITLINHIVSE